MITSGGTTTLGLYDNASEIRKKADITYVDSRVGDFQAQVVSLAGGHLGYATLALATTASTGLPANTVVEVTNDPTIANNGLYLWNGTTLTKSDYDPLTQAKLYTDNKVKDEISKSLSGNASKAENQFIYSLDGTTLRLEWNTSFFYTDIAVKEWDWYLITSKSVGDIVKSYYTANGDNILSSGGMESNQVFVQIPVGANRLVVNCLTSEQDNFSIKLLSKDEVKLFEKLTPAPAKVRDAFPQKNSYTGLLKQKCPKFFNKLHNKTGDLVVVMSGTSLTQGNLYTSHRADASSRPPLLHTNDLASYVFDALNGFWHGQKYMRYDHPDIRYYDDTEWVVSNDIKVGGVSIWDDRAEFKNGLTKTSISPNARVSAVVPAGAWQFNFIYRSDSQGANCVIDIYEGNGKIEVFNDTNWVEANKYSFSMRESAKTNRKGNTCYQKRLKMRCKNKAVGGVDSLNTVKNITISKGENADRFNVVGFEWSPREYMFTLINGARGSHNWGSGTTHNLENYQDTDIWEFNPDLILCEATTINWGGGWGYNFDPNLYVNYAKRSYYDEFADNPLSLKNTSGNFENCEVIFYGDTLSTHGGATQSWNSDKTPKFGIVTTVADNGNGSTENLGRSKTVFENYEAVETYMQSKPNIFVPVFYQFKELAERFYGNYPDAFVDSWTSGATLAFDTVHLNDNGAAFWAHLITPLFENL